MPTAPSSRAWGRLGARFSLPRVKTEFGPTAGRVALASLVFGAFAVVMFATSRATPLVPRSNMGFPRWESGPLHGLLGHLPNDWDALNLGFSAVMVAMLVAYGVVLMSVRSLSMRAIAICILVLHVILLLSPPLQLTDLFNYLGYARLGAVHHLNPYTHGINWELHDPIYRFSTWHNLRSPYGPLFTAISYPIALLPIPVAYWVLKLLAVLMSLGVHRARLQMRAAARARPAVRGRVRRANPVYLMYAVGGFHNDFFMLVPVDGCDRAAARAPRSLRPELR